MKRQSGEDDNTGRYTPEKDTHRCRVFGLGFAAGIVATVLGYTMFQNNEPAKQKTEPQQKTATQAVQPYGTIDIQQLRMPVFGTPKEGSEFKVFGLEGKVSEVHTVFSLSTQVSYERYAPLTLLAPEIGLVRELNAQDYSGWNMGVKFTPPIEAKTINFYIVGKDYHGMNPNLMPKMPQPFGQHKQRMPGFPDIDQPNNPSIPPIQSEPVFLRHEVWTSPEK